MGSFHPNQMLPPVGWKHLGFTPATIITIITLIFNSLHEPKNETFFLKIYLLTFGLTKSLFVLLPGHWYNIAIIVSTSIKQHVYDIQLKHEHQLQRFKLLNNIWWKFIFQCVGYFILEKGVVYNLKDLMTVEVPLHFSIG